MFERIMGVLRLNASVFEEIEHDESATVQAAIIVAVVALLRGIADAVSVGNAADTMNQISEQFGDQLGDLSSNFAVPTGSAAGAFVSAIIGAFVFWLVWSAITYYVGTKLFGGKATLQEMLRVVGFAQAPGIVYVLGAIPGLNCLVCLFLPLIFIWQMACAFIGLRQGLDLDNGKTLLTVLVSAIPALIIIGIVNSIISF
jgi:hypothetical protein